MCYARLFFFFLYVRWLLVITEYVLWFKDQLGYGGNLGSEQCLGHMGPLAGHLAVPCRKALTPTGRIYIILRDCAKSTV